jgi:hypothetical protein
MLLGFVVLGWPLSAQAQPTVQVIVASEEERWRDAEDAGRAAAARLSFWPADANQLRPRPPLPSPLERPYAWEMLGSPFVAVMPLAEIRFMGVPPALNDPNYGMLVRDERAPVAFRLSFLEARPYLEYGYGPQVLDAWAIYLGRSPAELPQLPITAEQFTRAIGRWLQEAGYLVGPLEAAPPRR